MHRGIRYQCDLCEYVSYIPSFLKQHMKEWHPEHAPDIFEHQKSSFDLEKYWKCEPCNKLFQTDDKYTNHNKTHNNSTKKKAQQARPKSSCKVCGTIIGNMKRHMRTKHPINKIEWWLIRKPLNLIATLLSVHYWPDNMLMADFDHKLKLYFGNHLLVLLWWESTI